MERRNLDILSGVIIASGLLLACSLAFCHFKQNAHTDWQREDGGKAPNDNHGTSADGKAVPQAGNATIGQRAGNGPNQGEGTEQQKLDLDRAIADANVNTSHATWAIFVASLIAGGLQLGAICIATYAALAAAQSANAAQEAIESARENARRELRAYMGVSEIWCESFKPETDFRVQIRFLNSGQTPAYDFNSEIRHVGPYDLNTTPETLPQHIPSDTKPTKAICNPRDTKHSFISARLNAAQISWIDAGLYRFWVYGHVTYRDVFENWYMRKFCFYVRQTDETNGTRAGFKTCVGRSGCRPGG